ncbi:hypothetical protein DL98DRAFT_435939 [Cadophora sp. DSE1049]|nr:hypothetical protein DL98DRAFT_435939 [Cadophora sp. DSE1049]
MFSNKIRKHLKKINTALLERYTCILYDVLRKREVNVLVQLQTGITRFNGYLYRIGAVESD